MAKKLLISATLVIAVLFVAVLVVFFMDFDSPDLGAAVLEEASEATGVQLSASGFHLNLISGLVADDVEASSQMPGFRYQVHLDQIVLEHRLLPLLSGTVAVDRLVLRRPQVELIETRSGGVARPSPISESESDTSDAVVSEQGAAGLALEVSEIELVDGSISMGLEGGESGGTSIEGLNITLRNLAFAPQALTPLHALSAEGELQVSKIALESTEVIDARGLGKLAGGRFELDELGFKTEQGSFRATMAMDFNSLPFQYTLVLEGDPIDVNAIAGSGGGGGFGPGRLELDAKGFGTDSRNINGKGVLLLEEGTLPSSPVLVGVEKALGRTALVGSRYKATQAPFRVENNRLILESFQLETEQAAVDLRGSVDLDGPLSLNLVVRTPRQGLRIREVRDEVLDLMTNDEGWVAIPFSVGGTVEEPSVLPDTRALAAGAGSGTRRLIQEKATEGVKSLFRRIK